MMGRSIVSTIILLYAFSAFAEGGYTNHAGNVVAGWPVKLTQKEVTLAEGTTNSQLSTFNFQLSTTNAYPLSIFPESEQRRIAADFYPLSIFPESEQRRIAADFLLRQGSGGQVGLLRVPVAVKRAITGAEKAMARSRKRAEKGLCTKEESDDFCAKSAAALKSYLDKQVKEGVITPAERKALER